MEVGGDAVKGHINIVTSNFQIFIVKWLMNIANKLDNMLI